jgi:perosamine synthetase
MKPHIPYTKPSITDLEVRYATDAAANGGGKVPPDVSATASR